MELNIIKIIKQLRQQLRHKPPREIATSIRGELEELRPIIRRREKPLPKRKPMPMVEIDGRELSLKNIAEQYNLDLRTVTARYKVGNRGRLLCRPTPAKKEATWQG